MSNDEIVLQLKLLQQKVDLTNRFLFQILEQQKELVKAAKK